MVQLSRRTRSAVASPAGAAQPTGAVEAGRRLRHNDGIFQKELAMSRSRFAPAEALALILVAVLLGACASTSLVNEWKSPDATGAPLRKVMVVGITKQPSVRRVFEDEFVARLQAAGVAAIPSYSVIGEDGQVDKPQLESAVTKVGADGVLITRLVRQEQMTQATGGYYGPVAPGGLHGWYSSAWVGYYDPPTVYQYDVVTLETSVFGTGDAKLLWSGTTETFAPSDLKKETAAFADLIIGALRKQKVI
jgi:hypothetical protein